MRLVRTVAYVLRFTYNSKSKAETRRFDVFSSEELMVAESLLYKKVQFDSFQEELLIICHNDKAPWRMRME